MGVPRKSIYDDNINTLMGLKNGEFLVIDEYTRLSFKSTLVNYLRRHPVMGIVFKSVRVSKDKTYFFKVDVTKKIGESDEVENFRD